MFLKMCRLNIFQNWSQWVQESQDQGRNRWKFFSLAISPPNCAQKENNLQNCPLWKWQCSALANKFLAKGYETQEGRLMRNYFSDFVYWVTKSMPIIMHKSTTGSWSVPFLHKQSIIWRIPHSFFSADILVAIPRWWFVPVETLAPHYISFVLIQFQPGVKRNAKAQYSHCDYLASLWPCSQQNLHWFHCPAQLQARSGQSSSARWGKNVCCQGMKKNLEVSFFC